MPKIEAESRPRFGLEFKFKLKVQAQLVDKVGAEIQSRPAADLGVGSEKEFKIAITSVGDIFTIVIIFKQFQAHPAGRITLWDGKDITVRKRIGGRESARGRKPRGGGRAHTVRCIWTRTALWGDCGVHIPDGGGGERYRRRRRLCSLLRVKKGLKMPSVGFRTESRRTPAIHIVQILPDMGPTRMEVNGEQERKDVNVDVRTFRRTARRLQQPRECLSMDADDLTAWGIKACGKRVDGRRRGGWLARRTRILGLKFTSRWLCLDFRRPVQSNAQPVSPSCNLELHTPR
ncbi:hypothetical protein B0H17DRAFT_1147988 [Mycena rosella]|uniref:Uncharacterized protein n=1 Tax=Mycena rosella TaxID=1033263 RepID=A0AAD7CGZ9_MYCRO|nr:hypothetical protein B0H17DRAFT_1147988 [Mycena rosella]